MVLDSIRDKRIKDDRDLSQRVSYSQTLERSCLDWQTVSRLSIVQAYIKHHPSASTGIDFQNIHRLQASATTAADPYSMQETWNVGVQIFLTVCPFVVASQKEVAIITRRAKTISHWTRQRQLKRDSVFHLFRRDESR